MSDLETLVANLAKREAQKLLASPRPVYITRHNSETVLGLPWRTLRDWSKAPDFPVPTVKHGKCVLIECEPLLDYFRELAAQPSEPKREADAADDVLAEVLGPGVLRAV